MEKDFEKYLHDTRNSFVEAVNQLQWNTGFRTKCENLLIAFDQMKDIIRKHSANTPVIKSVCDHKNAKWEQIKYCHDCNKSLQIVRTKQTNVQF